MKRGNGLSRAEKKGRGAEKRCLEIIASLKRKPPLPVKAAVLEMEQGKILFSALYLHLRDAVV